MVGRPLTLHRQNKWKKELFDGNEFSFRNMELKALAHETSPRGIVGNNTGAVSEAETSFCETVMEP